MTDEQKEKYANFLDKVSEILGLNKPVDILKLCAVTDEYFKPIEKHIADLEKKNVKLKDKNKALELYADLADGKVDEVKGELFEAKKIIGNLYAICKDNHYPNCSVLMEQAEQFLKEADR